MPKEKRFELSGVYKITNKINEKFYIGSGHSIFSRWYNHANHLKLDKHTNYKLQRAFNKYGFDNFKFEILELHPPEGLNDREQYYLDTLCKAQEYIKSDSTYFNTNTYNIKPLVEGTTGLPNKVEFSIKSSRTRGFGRILKINTEGEVVDIYELKSQAAEENNIGATSVYLSIRKKQVVRDKNFGFIDENDYVEGYAPRKLRAHNKGVKGVLTHPELYKVIYCYDVYGRFFRKFESLTSTAKYFNVATSGICKATDIPKKKILHRTGVHLYNFFSNEQDHPTTLGNFDGLQDDGNISVYNLFHEYQGDFCIETIKSRLSCHPASVSQAVIYSKILKGYYFIRE